VSDRSPRILGNSPALRAALARAARVAAFPVPVLIEGETGTGKELSAREIHRLSPRHGGPFVAVNCAAIPKDLFEAELFGHEKGAFTGAAAAKAGAFERASGGTLFLDEVGELPLEQQVKLLRPIQECAVSRVGATSVIPVDVRIVAATNRDLRARVAEGHFRDDLYNRIAGYPLSLPPLRERGRDVLAIADALLAREFAGKALAREARTLLLRHGWPGNVRELENVIRAAAIDARRAAVPASAVAPYLRAVPAPRAGAATVRAREVVRALLRETDRLAPAAIQAALGIGRTQRDRVLKQLEADGVLARRGRGRGTYCVAGPAGGM